MTAAEIDHYRPMDQQQLLQELIERNSPSLDECDSDKHATLTRQALVFVATALLLDDIITSNPELTKRAENYLAHDYQHMLDETNQDDTTVSHLVENAWEIIRKEYT